MAQWKTDPSKETRRESETLIRLLVVLPIALIYLASDSDPYRGFMQLGSKALCCGGQDCAALPDKDVRAVPGGYDVAGWGCIPNENAQNGFDQRYHLCHSGPQLYCFLTPSPGV